MHEDFEQDKVQVFFNGKEKLNTQFQTNRVLGLAFPGAVNENVKKGKHTLKVIVNDSISHKETFTLKADLYIGASYNRQAQIISFFLFPYSICV